MYKKIILTSLIFILTFSINGQNWKSKKIKGNGHVIEVNRTTSEYNDIAIGGAFDVILTKGEEGKITIKGEKNITPYIATEVQDGTLKIKYKNNTNITTTKKLTVTVNIEEIESISLGGSGKIYSNTPIKTNKFRASIGGSGKINLEIDSNTLKASIGGSGSINLKGTTNHLSVSIAGSGSINAYQLVTDETTANVAGSGNVKVTVNKAIKAKIVGSGNVYYKGNPSKINCKTVGSGNIIERN